MASIWMPWFHRARPGGFATGSGSQPILDGTSLAHTSDVVVVSINHRLNVLGSTYLGEVLGRSSNTARQGSAYGAATTQSAPFMAAIDPFAVLTSHR